MTPETIDGIALAIFGTLVDGAGGGTTWREYMPAVKAKWDALDEWERDDYRTAAREAVAVSDALREAERVASKTGVVDAPAVLDAAALRRAEMRARIKAMPHVPHDETLAGVREALVAVFGAPKKTVIVKATKGRTHSFKKSTWVLPGPTRANPRPFELGQNADGEVTITLSDHTQRGLTWRIAGRRTLDMAVKGLLWHLLEMDVYPAILTTTEAA